jgi:hypothetical protein
VHVDAAALAAFLAAGYPRSAIFNIAEPNGYAATDKACRELRWSHDFRVNAPQVREMASHDI